MRRYYCILTALAALSAGASGAAGSATPAFQQAPVALPDRIQLARVVDCNVPQAMHLPHRVRRETSIREMSLSAMLDKLTAFPHRQPGTEYGRRTEKFLANAFEAVGCTVTRQAVPVNAWEATRVSLEAGGREVACSAAPFSPFGTVSGRIVFVGAAQDLSGVNVDGAIVVAEQRYPEQPIRQLWDHRLKGTTVTTPEGSERACWLNAPGVTPLEAAEAGAAGLIHVLVDQAGDTPTRYSPYAGPFRGAPTAYVCAREGQLLKEAAESGASGTLVIEGQNARRFGDNIIAELPGISANRVYLFTTHHDSPYGGAVDDAASVAALLELARHYAMLPVQQRPGLMVFACTTGHYDGAVGVRMLAQDILPQWRYRYRGIFALEQVGARAVRKEGNRLVATDEAVRHDVFVPDNNRLRSAVEAALEAAQLPNTLVVPDRTEVYPVPPGEGGSLCAVGLPTVQFTSAPPYLLTDEDSRDKVDLGRVAQHVDLLVDIVSRL